MFQLLLKATNPNSSQPQTNPPKVQRKTYINNPLNSQTTKYQPTWKSSTDHNRKNYLRKQQQCQTPAFLQKLHELGHQIQEVNDEPQPLGSYEPSEKVSQVLSVNELTGEQCHPMILSNIQPYQKLTYDKLSLLKIRNQLSELRQIHLDLTEYLEDERRLNYDFQDKLCLDMEDFMLAMLYKYQKKSHQQQDINQMKTQKAELTNLLEKKDREYQKLSKQFVHLQSTLEQERNKFKGRNSRDILNDKPESTAWRSLEIEISTLKKQLAAKQQQIEDILSENQRLQEHIFDIEQRIVGVDLQVEKKLKEKLSLLPGDYRQPPASAPVVPTTQQTVELKSKVSLLQQKCRQNEQKCRQYQQKLKQTSDIGNKMAKIKLKEQELQQRQAILREAEIKNQQLKEVNYQRQHQILEAEENLSAKIADLRQKEAELSSWETELIRKANQSRQPLKFTTEEGDYRMSFQDQLNNSKEISLKSFGRTPQNGRNNQQIQKNIAPRRNYTQQDIETFNPRQELYKINQNRYETDLNPSSARREEDVRRQSNNVYTSKVTYSNTAAKNLKLVKSNYRDSRESSPYRNVEHRSRGHHGGAMLPGGSHYRDLSKNSRSSATKSIRGGFGSQAQGIRPRGDTQPVRPRGDTQQITGLSTKLQRLRQEIKREIDSIK